MTLEIDGYTVEIKVKNEYSKKFNKHDAITFLNTIAINASMAAKQYECLKMPALSEQSQRIWSDINETLYFIGAYK